MSKKLPDSTPNYTFLFTACGSVITAVCLSSTLSGLVGDSGVSDVTSSDFSPLFFLDIEETTVTPVVTNSVISESIDTEVLARRIGSGLATAGLGGVGTGIGLVFSGLIKGFSRNPSLKDDLFSYAIFGFALTEAIGLFALMMAFMLLYA